MLFQSGSSMVALSHLLTSSSQLAEAAHSNPNRQGRIWLPSWWGEPFGLRLGRECTLCQLGLEQALDSSRGNGSPEVSCCILGCVKDWKCACWLEGCP